MNEHEILEKEIQAEEEKLKALRDKKRERPAEYDAFMSQVETAFGVRSSKKKKGNDDEAATEDATAITDGNSTGSSDEEDDS